MPKTSNKSMTSKRFSCLPMLLFLFANSSGCIAVRNTSVPFEVTNCNQKQRTPLATRDFPELYDRGEVVRRWASNCKQRSFDWISNQHGKCLARKELVHCWCLRNVAWSRVFQSRQHILKIIERST